MMIRRCAECGESLLGVGGVRAFGRLFCSEDCADDYENGRPLTDGDIDDMYPDWSGSLGTTVRGWD